MIVFKITSDQAEQLKGYQYDTDSFCNPIQDIDGNWVISEIEHGFLNVGEPIEYKPIKEKGHAN